MELKTIDPATLNSLLENGYNLVYQFLKENNLASRNGWFYIEKKTEVYLRKTKRFVEDGYHDFVDIANIKTPEKYQKKGAFDRFLNFLGNDLEVNIYVENVLNEKFGEALIRRGFKTIPRMGYELCYYKLSIKE